MLSVRESLFFDTADIYGPHINEVLLGKALKELPREKVQVATKFGVVGMGPSGLLVNGSPEYVRSCCEAGLKRLGVEYIDLYYQHRVHRSVPIEETTGELKKLVEEGKVKYIGLSNASVDTIKRAYAVHPVSALQMEELGIGLVPYSPLGRGFFSGKAFVESSDEKILMVKHPRLEGENLNKNKILFTRVEKLAEKCTPAQLALAWVLIQGDNVVPIPGTTKIKNLDANIGSLRLKLTEDDIKDLSDAVPISEVAGASDYDFLFST
ncbi:hypothetical protein MKX01_009868 [Papaver californicum]|nr:hypothetical protein MKX01_009868 [Papaver californicum]